MTITAHPRTLAIGMVMTKEFFTERAFPSTLFLLSSYHQFRFLQRPHGQFPNNNDKQGEPIAYTGCALRKFLETAEQMDWYKDKLFILVADHLSNPQQNIPKYPGRLFYCANFLTQMVDWSGNPMKLHNKLILCHWVWICLVANRIIFHLLLAYVIVAL
jgi:hypothetical protein